MSFQVGKLFFGDEDRRKIYINHKNHHELGFLRHSRVMDLLDKTSISVVPSKMGGTIWQDSIRGNFKRLCNNNF